MLSYCPNCNKLENGEISYTSEDTVYSNFRDGYGMIIQNVICKECNYPLAGMIRKTMKDDDEIEYFKDLITRYQDGGYATKEEMLNIVKMRNKGSRNEKEILSHCDFYLNK